LAREKPAGGEETTAGKGGKKTKSKRKTAARGHDKKKGKAAGVGNKKKKEGDIKLEGEGGENPQSIADQKSSAGSLPKMQIPMLRPKQKGRTP